MKGLPSEIESASLADQDPSSSGLDGPLAVLESPSVPGLDYYAPDFELLKRLTNDEQFRSYVDQYRQRVSRDTPASELSAWFSRVVALHGNSTAGELLRVAELTRKYRGPRRKRCDLSTVAYRAILDGGWSQGGTRRSADRGESAAGVKLKTVGSALPQSGSEITECRDGECIT